MADYIAKHGRINGNGTAKRFGRLWRHKKRKWPLRWSLLAAAMVLTNSAGV